MPSFTTLGEVRRLVRLWLPRLGLEGYNVVVVVDSELEATAEVRQPRGDYREAVLAVSPWLVGRATLPDGMLHAPEYWTPARIEAVVVHELAHIAVRPMGLALELIDGHLHRDSATLLGRAFEAAEERVVEALAVALVEAFGAYC